MNHAVIILLALVCHLIAGCQAGPDFRAITAGFNASKLSGVARIELVPIQVGTSLLTLSHKITISDPTTTSAVAGEIVFLEKPDLPKPMEHSSSEGACKMLIYFQNGTAYCFYVEFRTGAAGAGVEYAIHPDLNLESAYTNRLPGNHTLGRGYSIKLNQILQTVIKDADAGWIKAAQ